MRGEFVVPADAATADLINFMVRHGRGLILLALTRARLETLRLPPMSAFKGRRTVLHGSPGGRSSAMLTHSPLRDADVIRTPEFEHAVQCVHCSNDVGRSTSIGAGS